VNAFESRGSRGSSSSSSGGGGGGGGGGSSKMKDWRGNLSHKSTPKQCHFYYQHPVAETNNRITK
jgi:hypothetical protein